MHTPTNIKFADCVLIVPYWFTQESQIIFCLFCHASMVKYYDLLACVFLVEIHNFDSCDNGNSKFTSQVEIFTGFEVWRKIVQCMDKVS